MAIKCVLHGSFSRHFEEIKHIHGVFSRAGIEVLAPKMQNFAARQDGFLLFEDELGQDKRMVELLYLHNLKQLGPNGFSYFVNPGGYIGKSASYELGIAQLTNTNCYFMHKLSDHPAYVSKSSIISPQALADFVVEHGRLPEPKVASNERKIHKLWQSLMVPGSVVATGAIIEHQPKKTIDKEVLLVKTHKWGNRYSIVGGKVKRNERLDQALLREVKEETNLNGEVGRHLCTFDQIKNSGYYQSGISHIFVDNVVKVKSKTVVLNDEAQDYIWARPKDALRDLDIEPNARLTLQLYTNSL